MTVSMDIGTIRLLISHAAAVHGLPASLEQVDLARIALKRLGLVGKSNERNRRPTEEELWKLFGHFAPTAPIRPRARRSSRTSRQSAAPKPCTTSRSPVHNKEIERSHGL